MKFSNVFKLFLGIFALIISTSWGYTIAPVGAVSVATFGALGDGVTDDGIALQKAYNSVMNGGAIYFEANKTYLIGDGTCNPGWGLGPEPANWHGQLGAVGGNFKFYGQDATIKVKDGWVQSSPNVQVLNFNKCKNFEIYDLTIDHNRANRTPIEGWENMTVCFSACSAFTLTNVRVKNSMCDAFFLNTFSLGHTDPQYFCHNGKFINCSSDNAYRQGMSIVTAWDIDVIGGFYNNTNGAEPKSGIDLEPDPGDYAPGVKNVLIKGVSFVGNDGTGLILTTGGSVVTQYVTVDGCYFSKNKKDGINNMAADVTVKNCVFYDFPNYGVIPYARDAYLWVAGSAPNCVITNNTFANLKDNTKRVIHILGTNATVSGNKLYDFNGTAIDPVSYNTGNDIQATKVITDPGLPISGGLSFTSSQSVVVPSGGKLGYKVTYSNTTNVSSVTCTFLKKPLWITTSADSFYGTAPKTFGNDSITIIAKAGVQACTMQVSITIAYYSLYEAEVGTLVSPMVIGTDVNAQGGKYISAVGGTNTINPVPEATYNINIPKAGDYYVWLKIYMPATSTWGTYTTFNNVKLTVATKPKAIGVYEWIRASNINTLASGANKFIIGHGNPLARIDAIVFTNSWSDSLPINNLPANILNNNSIAKKTGLEIPSITTSQLTSGRIKFILDGINTSDFSFDIYNVSGSLVKKINKTEIVNNKYIWNGLDNNLKSVRSGVYIARIKTANQNLLSLVLLRR